MRERLLAGGSAGVVVAALLVAAVVPGVIGSPATETAPPGRVDVHEVTIRPTAVSGSTVTLGVNTWLRHAGGPAENVTLLLRAVERDTSLVASTRRVDTGTLRGDSDTPVRGNLTVERAGGYRLETVVFRNGTRVDAGTTGITGVGSLDPPYARSTVEFHRFEGADLPTVEFSVTDARDGRATLNATAYLTNGGDSTTDDLRVVFKARQADSNVVADETTVAVGEIRPGRTEGPSARLTVPDGYDYYLDAVLWRDGVVVDTQRAAANLQPNRTLTVDRGQNRSGFEVTDFDRGEEQSDTSDDPAPTAAGGTPGFTVLSAAAAVVGVGLLARWRDE